MSAGSTYFNSTTMGQPIIWSGGQLNYYTDQGDLSPILPNSAANAFVANALAQWTSVSTAAITANAAGQLAEDVNGNNVEVNSEGVGTAPADITPSATQTPIGIVYDYDGSVTDALLGEGAEATHRNVSGMPFTVATITLEPEQTFYMRWSLSMANVHCSPRNSPTWNTGWYAYSEACLVLGGRN